MIDCIVADIRHNKVRVNPLTGRYIGLTEEAIRRFEGIVLTDEDKDVRLHGKFRYLAGRVWKSWDRIVHVVDRNKIWKDSQGQPPKSWPRMMLIDPHDEKPHALLWIAQDPEYLLSYCYREAWLANRTFRQVVEHIRQVETDARERIQIRIIDPNFGPKTQGNTKTTVREDFELEAVNIGYPMRFKFGDDHKALGRKKVAELLRYNSNEPISIINRPSLYICGDLSRCIYQIEHYVWPDKKDNIDLMIEKPLKKDDDFPDLLHYYSLVNNWLVKVSTIKGFGNAYK